MLKCRLWEGDNLVAAGAMAEISAVKRVIGSGGAVALGVMATRLAAFGISLAVARLADPGVFGAFTLFMSLYVLASELPTALDTTFIRFANDPAYADAPGVFVKLLLISKIAYGITIACAGLFLADVLAEEVFNKPGAVDAVRYALVSGTLVAVFYALLALYQRNRRFGVQALIRPLPNLLVLAVVVFGEGVRTAGLRSLLYTYVTVSALAAFAAGGQLIASVRNGGSKLPGIWRRYVSHAAVLGGASALNLFLSQLDAFFVAAYLSMEDLGLYGAALRIYALLGIVITVLTTILVPEAPDALRRPEIMRHYRSTAGIFLAASLAMSAMLAVAMGGVLEFAFGAEYRGAETVANLLLLKVLAGIAGVPFQVLLQCGTKPSLFLFIVLARLIVSWMLLAFLVPAYGGLGAAGSAALAAWMVTGVMAWLVLRRPSEDPVKG